MKTKHLLLSSLWLATALLAQAQLHSPAGWDMRLSGPPYIPGGQTENSFEAGRDTHVFHGGHASLTIKSISSAASQGWRAITQAIRADGYRGKRVRFRGYLKLKSVTGFAGLWMRVDSVNRTEAFDNMGNRPLTGTVAWKPVSVVLDVPKDASVIAFGPLLGGTGQMWADDTSLEVVDPKSVAVTGGWMGPDYSHDPLKPVNLDFTSPPQTPSKLDVPGWTTNANGWNDAVHRDAAVTYDGKPAVFLERKDEENNVALFQEIKAAPYRGKRVQFQVFVKANGKVDGGAMMAIPGGGAWAVAKVSNLMEQGGRWVPDTREWKPVAAVLDIPEWANCIQLGLQLDGQAQIWASEGSFQVVNRSTPVTYTDPLVKIYTSGDLAKLPKAPVNLGFEK